MATFYKLRKNKAVLFSNLNDVPIVIKNIPKTTIKFDTYDIAPFGTESTDFGPETRGQEMLKAWLECFNLRKVARQFGLPTITCAERIIQQELKAILSSVLTEKSTNS